MEGWMEIFKIWRETAKSFNINIKEYESIDNIKDIVKNRVRIIDII